MEMLLDQRRLRRLLEDFYAITGVRVGIYNVAVTEQLAYPQPHSSYCTMIQTCRRGLERCVACDRSAYEEAVRRDDVYVYRCHAGLTEAIAPIRGADRIVAYLMVGQFRQEGMEDEWETLQPGLRGFGLDMETLREAYYSRPTVTRQHLRACAHVLQACSAYIWLDNYIRVQSEPLPTRVERYIRDNLASPLSIRQITQDLGVGKTTLCTAVKDTCGTTVNDLIRAVRIDRAKALLQSGDLPISCVAEQVGYGDYNYFARVFKSETGVSPSRFRKLCEDELALRGRGTGNEKAVPGDTPPDL